MASLNIMTADIQKAFDDSDAYWDHALQLDFGNEAGQARYEEHGKGAPGSELRRAYDARDAARSAWTAAAFGERN